MLNLTGRRYDNNFGLNLVEGYLTLNILLYLGEKCLIVNELQFSCRVFKRDHSLLDVFVLVIDKRPHKN